MTGQDKLKVVLFSGGSGTGSISEALLKNPDIELTMLVNAYDDGKSTGLLRRFIPGMLGPSDIRKVVSSLLKHQPDRSSQALRKMLEYRMPTDITVDEAIAFLKQLINWEKGHETNHEILIAKEQLSLKHMRDTARYLAAFIHFFESTYDNKSWFTFADNSLGNLIFGGCFLLAGSDFNQAIKDFADYAEVGDGVVDVTRGENLVLVALKADGRFLADEAAIVGPQDDVPLHEIFLLSHYIEPKIIDTLPTLEAKVAKLRELETLPQMSREADVALRTADIIIYGPGTQHSSLYPSYLTMGVAEAIQANKQAEKIFIANIARDHDIMAADGATLVQGLIENMTRKGTCEVKPSQLVTRFFFQKPDKGEATNYVPFESHKFTFPLEKVVWIDLEGATGKHSGGRTVAELLIIVEEHLRKRIRHVPHKVSIIIPVLNEIKTVQQVLENVRVTSLPTPGLEKEIIVVDGGSTDGSYQLLMQEPGIRLYQMDGSGGRGSALRYGIEKARGDLLVFFPSDGEYETSDIARVINPLVTQEFPVVFGSRAFRTDLSGTLQRVYGNRSALITVSKYGGMLLSVVALLMYHRYVGDPLTSVKAFNARVFRGMEFRRSGVDFDLELVAKVARAKYPILEVPVSYKARTVEEGKKITVGDGVKCLLTLLRFARYKPSKQATVVGKAALETSRA
jgi:2-phospho-L-lactate transferase/gluconeogenesis factor (CofD/UPF0052 family)